MGPPRTPISKPTPQPGLCGQRMDHGAPPLAGTPLGPAALAYHLWRDPSSSSANVPSLRASILNPLRLMNKHSFFNGEEKAPDFFFLKKSPKPPCRPAGHTLAAWGCSNVCQVVPPLVFHLLRAHRANARAISADRKTKMKNKKQKTWHVASLQGFVSLNALYLTIIIYD